MREWLNKIHDLEFVPASNQDPRDGFVYTVKFFNNKKEEFAITPNYVGGINYVYNEKLEQLIEQLLEY